VPANYGEIYETGILSSSWRSALRSNRSR